jgi:hypothetical protein
MWWVHALLMFMGMVVIQVFAMPYMMAERPDHVYFSVTQGWMGAAMGAAMVALGGILHPMPWWAWLVTLVVGVVSVLGYRLQWFITDAGYVREMIPHHSMALVTSRPRVRDSTDPVIVRLAEQIITVQEREPSSKAGSYELSHLI